MSGLSKKTAVIELLFQSRWDEATRSLVNSMVTISEVQAAIQRVNELDPENGLSDRNPANFWKDFRRTCRSANRNWPDYVLQRRYSAKQRTGDNRSFEFVPFEANQTVPFSDALLSPTDATPVHRIESVSLPLASRRLGRPDETWLIQVAVRQRVLETHFSLFSPHNVVQIDHLQMGIKLRRTEIDALYLLQAYLRDESRSTFETEPTEIIVTCEVKGLRDDILPDQVLQQVTAAFQLDAGARRVVIPVAIKALGASRIHVIEFVAVTRDQIESLAELAVASNAIYEFSPAIPGIGS